MAQQAINRFAPRKATIMECLALGVVPIINENDSTNTAELRFGDNVTWLSEISVSSSGLLDSKHSLLT